MKKISILLSSLAFTMLVSCGPGQKDAIKYNDKIMNSINDLSAYHTNFLNQIDGHNIDSLKSTQLVFSQKSKASLEDISKIGPFGENKEFEEAALNYFKTINSIADHEGKQMVEIMSKDSANYTDADIDKINELAEKFDNDYNKVYDQIEEVQAKFAKQWKFKIENK